MTIATPNEAIRAGVCACVCVWMGCAIIKKLEGEPEIRLNIYYVQMRQVFGVELDSLATRQQSLRRSFLLQSLRLNSCEHDLISARNQTPADPARPLLFTLAN